MGNSIGGGLVGNIVATNFINHPNPQGGSGVVTTLAPTTTCHAPLSIEGFYPLYTSIPCAISAGNGSFHSHILNGVTYYMPEGVPFTHGTTTSAPTTLAPTTLAPVTTQSPSSTPKPPSNVVVIPAPVGTTLAPTTLAPTTLAPTTLAPTTLAPTTLAPTTLAPTTLAPTTLAPTTLAPTTLAPTTLAPTTLAPTTTLPLATTPQPTTTSAPIPELWSPKSTKLWLDSSDECSLVMDGTSVEKWRDKSGNGNDATQSSNALQPSDVNLGDGVEFDGSGEGFLLTDEISESNMSLFVVMKGDGYVVANDDDSRILFYDLASNPDVPLHNLYWQGVASCDNKDVPNHDATKVQILEFASHGTTSNVRVNGVNSLTQNISTNAPFEIDRIGMKWDSHTGVGTWDGNILEIIAVTSTTDREKIEGYLAHKWGLEGDLPSNHNFKSSAPTEIIDPEDHPYSLRMHNACEAGGISFIAPALDLKITAPSFDLGDFFEIGGQLKIISKEGSSSEVIEPSSVIPSDVSSINWIDYFADHEIQTIDNSSSFYIKGINDFGLVRPQNDQVWLNYKFYFILQNAVVHSGNCELFVDHPNCTTTIAPTTTRDPSIPTTTRDPSLPTTTFDPNPNHPERHFPNLGVNAYGGCMNALGDIGSTNRDDYFLVDFTLDGYYKWGIFGLQTWRDSGEPVSEYYNYIEGCSMQNHELEYHVWQSSPSGQISHVQDTLDLSQATFRNYYYKDQGNKFADHLWNVWGYKVTIQIPIDIDQDPLEFYASGTLRSKFNAPTLGQNTSKFYHPYSSSDSIGLTLPFDSLCFPPTSTTPFPLITSTTCPPAKYNVGDMFYDDQGAYRVEYVNRWYSTCEPYYTMTFFGYMLDYDPCSLTITGQGSSANDFSDSDLDAMVSSVTIAQNSGWIVCPTSTTYLPSTTPSQNSSLSVGQTTTWWGVSVTIEADNGDGSYDIRDENGYMNYSIQGSELSTDISGNPI